MARCAAMLITCERPNDVLAWTSVASPTASAISQSRSLRPWGSTLSMRNFELAGSTSPASRFTSMSERPTVSCVR